MATGPELFSLAYHSTQFFDNHEIWKPVALAVAVCDHVDEGSLFVWRGRGDHGKVAGLVVSQRTLSFMTET